MTDPESLYAVRLHCQSVFIINEEQRGQEALWKRFEKVHHVAKINLHSNWYKQCQRDLKFATVPRKIAALTSERIVWADES